MGNNEQYTLIRIVNMKHAENRNHTRFHAYDVNDSR